MSIDTTKDEGFNMFMQALGFVWVEKPNSAPATGSWRHYSLDLTFPSTNEVQHIVERYNEAMRRLHHKQFTAGIRSTMLDMMGLQLADVRNRDGDTIAEDIVTVDRY